MITSTLPRWKSSDPACLISIAHAITETNGSIEEVAAALFQKFSDPPTRATIKTVIATHRLTIQALASRDGLDGEAVMRKWLNRPFEHQKDSPAQEVQTETVRAEPVRKPSSANPRKQVIRRLAPEPSRAPPPPERKIGPKTMLDIRRGECHERIDTKDGIPILCGQLTDDKKEIWCQAHKESHEPPRRIRGMS